MGSPEMSPDDVGQVSVLLIGPEVFLPSRLVANRALGLGDARALQFAQYATPACPRLFDR